MDPTISQVFVATLWPYLQEWFKTSTLPIFSWISQETRKMNIFLSPLVAFLTTIGFSWHSTADPNGGHLVGIYIPSAAIVYHALAPAVAKFLAQWATQHAIYTKLIQDPKVTQEMLTELKKLSAGKV